MLIVTNRTVAGSGTGAAFSRAFAPGQPQLSLAQASARAKGKWSLKQLVSDADDAQVAAALAPVFSAERPVLVYLHGNNNTPESCFERCAVLEAMYGVTVVGFSWPSEGSLPDGADLPGAPNPQPGDEDDLADVRASNRTRGDIFEKARRYRQAKNNAQDSVVALARFLRLVAVARLQADAQPFSVAAHSLGGHFLQYTLEIDAAREALGAAFNVALLAPCVRAAGHKDWVGKLRPRGRVFVTYNEGDSVLFGAYIVDGNQLKLGTDPGGDLVRNGVTRYVSFTGSPVGFGGHGYFVYPRLPKKTRGAFTRIFGSRPDIEVNEPPRQVYALGCDADGVTCHVGAPRQPDDGG